MALPRFEKLPADRRHKLIAAWTEADGEHASYAGGQ
jgi:hypothetical protein